MTTNASSRTTGYLALVRDNANFRNLWLGQIISLLGDWFNLIASASLVGALTQSGLAVGGLFVVRMLAPFLVSPIAGVAADRYNRKRLLILTDLLRGVTVLGFLLVREPGQVWLLYALTAIQLGISGFFFPARAAILPDIVSKSELGAANALTSAAWSVMLALGAALGGLVAGGWGAYPAFIIDAGTFLLSAFFVSRVVYQHKPRLGDTSIRAALVQYVDGLRYLAKRSDILVIALTKAAFGLTVSGAFQVLQVRITEEIFVIGEGGGISLGIMYAVVGAATGLGPIVARRFTGDRDRPMRVAIILAYGISVIGLLLASTLASFGIVLVGTFLRGFGAGLNWVFSTQLLLQLLPDRVRGRVFSTEFAALTLMSAASSAVAGWGLDNSGYSIAEILQITAGGAMFFGLLWTLWLLFGSRQSPAEDEEVQAV